MGHLTPPKTAPALPPLESRVPRGGGLYLNGLRMVEATARTGGMTRAARELGVSHSAISQGIDRLEKSLGQPLFTSDGRQLRPSPHGLELAECYRQATALVARAIDRATDPESDDKITLGGPADLLTGWLGHRLQAALAFHPRLAVVALAPDDQTPLSRCDLALVVQPHPPLDCETQRLWGAQLTPVCTPQVALRLLDHPPEWILTQRLLVEDRGAWSDWFGAARVRWDGRYNGLQCDSPGLSLDMALAGAGVALACRRAVHTLLFNGRLAAPFDIDLLTPRSVYAVWNRSSAVNAQVQRLVDWLAVEANCDRVDLVDAKSTEMEISAAVGGR